MTIRISVGIQKGGVSKTTTVSILAELLASSGFKVLVLDLDSQGNATQMLTQKSIYTYSGNTMIEAIRNNDAAKYILNVKENLDLIPADDMLITFSRYIYQNNIPNPHKVLNNTMKNIDSEYDFVLMDLPPNIGDIVVNAIAYSDHVIIPVNLDAFGLDALNRFIMNIDEARNNGHTNAELLGIVYAMRDSRSALERAIGNAIRSRYKDKVFDSEIKRRAKLKEFALTGTQMERKAELDALEEYISLANEVIQRVMKGEQS